MKELVQLYKKTFHTEPTKIEKLKGAGSNRVYYRLFGQSQSVIGVVGESLTENESFIYLAQHFENQKLNTPILFSVSDDKKRYLQEDLGDTSLFDYIRQGRESGSFSEKELKILEKTIRQLAHFQHKAAENLDFSNCYPQAEFDSRTIFWDLNYFKYNFLKTTGLEIDEPALENDFEKIADSLLKENQHTFLYRDFQSRNVMIKNDEPYFIDFQGGRRGPIYYDVASFLWQAKANLPENIKSSLIDAYLDELKIYQTIKKDLFVEKLHLFVFFRTLQVLGAYGFRGYFEGKQHFIESIPFAIKNLKNLLDQNISKNYPYLTKILYQLCNLPQMQEKPSWKETNNLTVTINSFSFKKGYPEDPSGNGGGYVFDCRGMHNPGRYEEYKKLTGRDQPVIDFLEREGEIQLFLQHVYKLADAHIQNYIQRGFEHLMFSFGCTGGQHRSVYSAEHTAHYIAKKYNVKVILQHREQNIIEKFN
jgi:aminoglycoside/choline kinase family phosphotransferase